MTDQIEIRAEPVSTPDQLTMTFPAYRESVRSGDAITVCAWAAGEPVGLAAAADATVLSISVKSAWRNKGIAARMLAELERQMIRRGTGRASLTYLAGNPSTPAVERLLDRAGWSAPQPRMMICYSTVDRLVQGDWVRKHRGRHAAGFFPWRELTAAERNELATALGARFPDALSPFRDEAKIEPCNSIGVRRGGRVAGWFLTHRSAHDTVRYSTLYLDPALAGLGLGFAMAAEAVWLHANSPLALTAPNCTMDFSPGSAMMSNFVRKRLLPTLTATRISMGREKLLAGA